jgi:DNA-binding NtrC family response regulator
MDVRIIAATNLDLQAMIEDGRFLRDLLYRIEVISIRVPPLRERQDDIPLLTEHYIRHYARQYDRPVTGIAPAAMGFLLEHPWKGNVRELKNCVARAVILSKGRQLTLEDLPESVRSDRDGTRAREGGGLIGDLPETGVTLKGMEAELIRATLRNCGGNKSLAARQLGISRKSLYEKMERYGISREPAKSPSER